MHDAFLCDFARTPIGRHAGALAPVRTDDLAAIPIKALMARNAAVDWSRLDEVIFGCANQAGEDNRNVARMAVLLSGLPVSAGAATINRLCGSGLDAVGSAARAIRLGEIELAIAGGVESMSRAPFVMPKADAAWSRDTAIYDTTIGWRFVNKLIEKQYGIDSMGETAENLAEMYQIARADQDRFAQASQIKAGKAMASGRLAKEIVPVAIPSRKGEPVMVTADEHPRPDTTLESLTKLKAPFRAGGSVTAGNASGVNDGAAALILASEKAAKAHGLTPKARVLGMATAGVEPRIMGFGPVPATQKLLARLKIGLDQIDVIELNEAFAAQALSCTRALGLADDDPRVNPNGGAIALGHPLGMSGARLAGSAALELTLRNKRYALCSMCIGVGQGISVLLERV
ncbi:MAG: 3-oxoadipyl-CoA thiolase [Rhodospirillales bacterium]|nr:3-oxoadipyl-CoA thiolase [Rhodospirillales bacterium]